MQTTQTRDNQEMLNLFVAEYKEKREEKKLLAIYRQVEKLILYHARRFCGIGGAELDDLLQEGFLALYEALDGYQEEKGNFSNYLSLRIRARFLRYIANTGRTIRLPVYVRDRLRKLAAFKQAAEKEGRELSDLEIMQALSITRDELEHLEALAEVLPISSLSADLSEDGEIQLEDTIPAESDTEAEALERIQRDEVARVLWAEVDACGPAQACIIRMIYQEDKGEKDCAEDLGCDVGRVHALRNGAMAKLKKREVKKRLREALPDSELYSKGLQRPGGLSSFTRTRESTTERAALAAMRREQDQAARARLASFRLSMRQDKDYRTH